MLQSGDNLQLRATLDRLIGDVVAAQEPSGYLNTWYVEERAKLRFTEMHGSHELYCLGHLLQAAIAYHRATGDRKLLDAGIRFTAYVLATLGPAPKRPALTGHPEFEMALVELYRVTKNRQYLDFAHYLLSGVERERLKLTANDVSTLFSGAPFTARTRLEGHAVRAMYACSGATDYYLETGGEAYGKTLEALWQDMVSRRMYITGGVGSRSRNEAFGDDYELPNLLAYTESCAAIGNMMWNWRMLAATGEARFADVLERALYNGVNSGMSLDGTLYCYRNPLETHGKEDTHGAPVDKLRNPWYSTTCCPPNLERTLAALPGYFYSTSKDGVVVHLYHSGRLDWHLEDGTPLVIEQTTGYPWQGEVKFKITPGAEKEFTLFLRVPDWSANTQVKINGAAASVTPRPGQYLALRRAWKPGDQVELTLDLRPRVMEANRRLHDNLGRVAVERGPLVYCLEGADQPDLRSIFETV
ncbi:MAG: glycoside hydrolase family 127 protein, partial [Acidobacteria bacterium]|nr:glycoside hydrolase family 127 protein [Acidobacteriota bacterium]